MMAYYYRKQEDMKVDLRLFMSLEACKLESYFSNIAHMVLVSHRNKHEEKTDLLYLIHIKCTENVPLFTGYDKWYTRVISKLKNLELKHFI